MSCRVTEVDAIRSTFETIISVLPRFAHEATIMDEIGNDVTFMRELEIASMNAKSAS